MNYTNLLLDRIENSSEDFINWYVLYCLESEIKVPSEEILTDYHHILPKCLFPEFRKLNENEWNGCHLPVEKHYIAHRILSFSSKKDFFVFSDIEKKSKKYLIGRKQTKAINSIKNKNFVVVRHKDSPRESLHFRVSKDDPLYLSGEYIHSHVGSTKSDTCKAKMSENGIKNHICYHHPETDDIKFFPIGVNPPEGYIKGQPEKRSKIYSDRMTDLLYFHDPVTKEQRRFKLGDEPNGWIHGKISFGESGNPFSGVKIYKNHLTGETSKIDINEPYPPYCCNLANSWAYIYKNYVSFERENLVKLTGFTNNTLILSMDEPNRIIVTKTRDNKAKLHIGSTYGSLGFSKMKISDLLSIDDHQIKYTYI